MKTYEFTVIASGLDPEADGARDAEVAKDVEDLVAADRELTRRLELLRREMREAVLLNQALGVSSAKTLETMFAAAADQERGRSAQQSHRSGLRAWMAAGSRASASIWSRLTSIARAGASIASFGATREPMAYPFQSDFDAMSDDWNRVAERLRRQALIQASE